jgi:hypothetical protein
MCSQSNRRISRTTVALIIIILIVVIAIVAVGIYEGSQKPQTFTVSGVSLNPNTIIQNSSSTLNFTIKNNDETRSYQVKVEFNTTASTLFSLNNKVLPLGNDGLQYYNMTLQSSQQSTYSFKVVGILTGGASSTVYSIPLSFCYQNGTIFDTERLSLTVNS